MFILTSLVVLLLYSGAQLRCLSKTHQHLSTLHRFISCVPSYIICDTENEIAIPRVLG